MLGAASHHPWTGCLIAMILVGVHLALSVERSLEVRLVVLATAVGAVVEMMQIAAGTYRFTSGTVMTEAVPPPWLLAMWAQFATTFRFSLRRVITLPVLALLFGAAGGPIAFLAGERLGAVTLLPPLGLGLLRLSISWALALVIFSAVVRRGLAGTERAVHANAEELEECGDEVGMGSVPEWARQARSMWRYRGQERPPFAVVPGSGKESVWDYPRPPRIESDVREVIVQLGAHEIARSRRSVRVLETASPPTFYIPADDVRTEFLEMEAGTSRCEWKGEAHFWSVIVPGRRVNAAAWSYANPLPGYERIRGYFAFYPSLLACAVDSIPVVAQPGRFYGGWVTPEVVGPFKGEPGSESW